MDRSGGKTTEVLPRRHRHDHAHRRSQSCSLQKRKNERHIGGPCGIALPPAALSPCARGAHRGVLARRYLPAAPSPRVRGAHREGFAWRLAALSAVAGRVIDVALLPLGRRGVAHRGRGRSGDAGMQGTEYRRGGHQKARGGDILSPRHHRRRQQNGGQRVGKRRRQSAVPRLPDGLPRWREYGAAAQPRAEPGGSMRSYRYHQWQEDCMQREGRRELGELRRHPLAQRRGDTPQESHDSEYGHMTWRRARHTGEEIGRGMAVCGLQTVVLLAVLGACTLCAEANVHRHACFYPRYVSDAGRDGTRRQDGLPLNGFLIVCGPYHGACPEYCLWQNFARPTCDSPLGFESHEGATREAVGHLHCTVCTCGVELPRHACVGAQAAGANRAGVDRRTLDHRGSNRHGHRFVGVGSCLLPNLDTACTANVARLWGWAEQFGEPTLQQVLGAFAGRRFHMGLGCAICGNEPCENAVRNCLCLPLAAVAAAQFLRGLQLGDGCRRVAHSVCNCSSRRRCLVVVWRCRQCEIWCRVQSIGHTLNVCLRGRFAVKVRPDLLGVQTALSTAGLDRGRTRTHRVGFACRASPFDGATAVCMSSIARACRWLRAHDSTMRHANFGGTVVFCGAISCVVSDPRPPKVSGSG
jgi:hypothetical protein